MTIADDNHWLNKARRGDVKAFSRLVAKYQGDVRYFLASRMQDLDEAEDLAQEAFIVAFQKLNEFSQDKAFKPWVMGIAANLMRNYMRKAKPVLVDETNEIERLMESAIEKIASVDSMGSRGAALKACLDELDGEYKQLLIMHYVEGYTVGELTKQLQVKHSTMTMRLYRIRDLLRKCVTGKTGEA
ncbi:RNA polymerase sigma factor [Gayadomonas joobiniege]|uniref:RNA polymerase sigma factor n=1 Tax=Gayadomonas joobiniege TaxID=1234606 RepID=UPI0003820ACC|nr:sigma-70 family RNA polymerase sigma factor [Gayadomonas joobiniege]